MNDGSQWCCTSEDSDAEIAESRWRRRENWSTQTVYGVEKQTTEEDKDVELGPAMLVGAQALGTWLWYHEKKKSGQEWCENELNVIVAIAQV